MTKHLKSATFSIAILITVVAAILVTRRSQFQDVFQFTCRMVAVKFYEHSQRLDQWAKSCEHEARETSPFWRREKLIRVIQRKLDELEVSHLMIYNPEEEKYLWKGQSVDSGIRIRMVDGLLIVSEVLLNSAAAKVDVKPGDVLKEIEGQSVLGPSSARTGRGLFTFERKGKEYQAYIEPTELQVDSSPQVVDAGEGVALLRITSFRSDYFDEKIWKEKALELNKFKKIVVDLRDNSGGNFVAMLRALSPFFCVSQQVGLLQVSRKKAESLPAMEDNTDDFYQIQTIDKYREIGLKTFAGYGCLKQPVVVLTDSGTASVSEVFADAIKLRPRSSVWGAATRGDVVLAIWYDIPFFAKGYSLSIPEAQVLNSKGETLEGRGVWPDQDLFYILKEAMRGEDSWLLRAYLHK